MQLNALTAALKHDMCMGPHAGAPLNPPTVRHGRKQHAADDSIGAANLEPRASSHSKREPGGRRMPWVSASRSMVSMWEVVGAASSRASPRSASGSSMLVGFRSRLLHTPRQSEQDGSLLVQGSVRSHARRSGCQALVCTTAHVHM